MSPCRRAAAVAARRRAARRTPRVAHRGVQAPQLAEDRVRVGDQAAGLVDVARERAQQRQRRQHDRARERAVPHGGLELRAQRDPLVDRYRAERRRPRPASRRSSRSRSSRRAARGPPPPATPPRRWRTGFVDPRDERAHAPRPAAAEVAVSSSSAASAAASARSSPAPGSASRRRARARAGHALRRQGPRPARPPVEDALRLLIRPASNSATPSAGRTSARAGSPSAVSATARSSRAAPAAGSPRRSAPRAASRPLPAWRRGLLARSRARRGRRGTLEVVYRRLRPRGRTVPCSQPASRRGGPRRRCLGRPR